MQKAAIASVSNPEIRPSQLSSPGYRICRCTRSHARAMRVEAAWAAAKAPGPLHALFVRLSAERGQKIAAVALARKLTVLCWHLLTKETDYRRVRPALFATKRRAMELRFGQPQKKGNRLGPAHPYPCRFEQGDNRCSDGRRTLALGNMSLSNYQRPVYRSTRYRHVAPASGAQRFVHAQFKSRTHL